MNTLGLSADEVLSTTRSVRKRLDFDRPVDPALIKECLEFAIQAPTGSNSQAWEFLVVTDTDKRQALGDLYRQGWEAYTSMPANAATLAVGAEESRASQQMRVVESAAHLAENFHRVPVMLLPCLPGRLEQLPSLAVVSMLAGIIPSAWSFMLAARERGLGTCWTTIHLLFEKEAAELLAIPYQEVTQVALITVAHTIGTEFHPAKRDGGAAAVTRWESWQ